MKQGLLIIGVLSFMFLVSCHTTKNNTSVKLSENQGRVDWVFPDNKKYGVIRRGDDKWFPYYDKLDILRWDDILNDMPSYGETAIQLNIANSNQSTNVYLYEHKLSRHRAVSYIRMITQLGENDSDRSY